MYPKSLENGIICTKQQANRPLFPVAKSNHFTFIFCLFVSTRRDATALKSSNLLPIPTTFSWLNLTSYAWESREKKPPRLASHKLETFSLISSWIGWKNSFPLRFLQSQLQAIWLWRYFLYSLIFFEGNNNLKENKVWGWGKVRKER